MSFTVHVNHKHPGRRRQVADGRVSSAYQEHADLRRDELAAALSSRIRGEVRFDAGSRALYATDASNYRQVPIGVVIPRSLEDVIEAIDVCRRFDAPIVARGGGTSLAGQGCNVAVLIDFSKYLHGLLSIDSERRTAEVEPGCVLDQLRTAANPHGLTFGPDPATHDRNTLGGMIGNNSCGVHSVVAGRTSDNVESLEILTYDGLRMVVGPTSEQDFRRHIAAGGRRAEIFGRLDEFRNHYRELILTQYPHIPRRVSGYENLDRLLPEHGFNVAQALVGTEGTCVTVLRATVKLIPNPQNRVLAIIGFDDIVAAAEAVPQVLEFGPVGLEGIDDLLVDFVLKKHLHTRSLKLLPSGNGWLVAEFAGDDAMDAMEAAQRAAQHFERKACATRILRKPEEKAQLWELREAALAATAHIPDQEETYPGWEDSAVRREDLGKYLRDLKDLFHRHGYEASVYGHFGDGLVHCRVPFGLRTEKGLVNWQRFLEQATDLVVRYGGSISGEHGDGQARGELLERMYGPELVGAFGEFKAIWDPLNRMNPGKVVDPFPATSNLRLGPSYQPHELETELAYPEEGGSFVKATARCVGVGACRRRDSEKGVMCPSYMVTNEEMHSTRGRAHLLFEMLHGGEIQDVWRSKAVEEALDLCLACKGCKSDCPVNVDMAKYKSEFRAHYYKGRLRPRAAYSMGLIHRWSRLAGAMPALANAVLQAPLLGDISKWIGGIAPQRTMPRFSDESFTRWFRRQKPSGSGGERVVLWPDTFNNYFRAQTAISATRALEALGYRVEIPDRPLCCGRPLYDWGMLDSARKLWRKTIEVLATEIRRGTTIIGLEPACVSAFRDELLVLFPGDETARRLSKQVRLFSEFVEDRCKAPELPNWNASALVQTHCHHHAVLDANSDAKLFNSMGIDHRIMKSGCCGMAGSFGFERDKYEISQKAADRVLIPEVRKAPVQTFIVANGFSCREQIEQATGRSTLHTADMLAKALGVA
jgi:FAD/FMN-containing dehydrogenase/Fe-S oxidoreductase